MTYDLRPALLCIMSFTALGFSFQPVWQKAGSGIYEPEIRTLETNPKNAQVIFAATDRALYRSRDAGKTYQIIGRLTGINDLYIDPQLEYIYAAADNGLYESRDGGGRWQKIYAAVSCLSVLSDGQTLYLGTSRGLLTKSTHASHWAAVGGELGNTTVYQMTQNNRYVYFATARLVYGFDKKARQYLPLFSAGVGGGINGEEQALEDEGNTEGATAQRIIRFVAISAGDDAGIYMATTSGIFTGTADGRHWQRMPADGVPFDQLTSLIVLNDASAVGRRILAGTEGGAFIFADGRWTPLYAGMETNEVHGLALHGRGKAVYAATDKGVFYLSLEEALPYPPAQSLAQVDSSHSFVLSDFANEPTIREVHRWAIDYAEVSPDKITSWRSLARQRAVFPDLSVGIDRADGEYFHWDTGSNPDNLLKGRDFLNWDVSLSWDLGDLIWSTDQTTIDSRSKLMVELREDILDQVTRVYFERRRLQAELITLSGGEPTLQLDKQLRLEELTALLDAFTGGKFSKLIAANENAKEEIR